MKYLQRIHPTFWLFIGCLSLCSARETKEDTPRDFDSLRAGHWSWKELDDPKPPKVKAAKRVRNDIDRFILSKLETEGHGLSEEADANTLNRRAHLDLVGLPPGAVDLPEKGDLIDGLMSSPHYGERWARHWLDVARYAESHGFEQDYDRPHAYHYRDFVIQALNQDMPFDQFARWQLAGDEIAPDNHLAMMATGFLGAGVFPTQLTEKEFESARYDELDDMANTSGMAFLGLSIGCARCHDHKFDPITSKEYYQFVSTFGLTIRSEIDIPIPMPGGDKKLEVWKNEKARLSKELTTFERDELPKRFRAWAEDPPKNALGITDWLTLGDIQPKSLDGAKFAQQGDGSFIVGGPNPGNDRWVLTANTNLQQITALRIEALTDKSMRHNGPGRAGNGNFALSDIRVFAKVAEEGGKGKAVKLVNPRADHQQNTGNLSVASSIDNDKRKSGWAIDGQIGKPHLAVFEFAQPLEFKGASVLTIEMDFFVNTSHTIGRPRFSISSHPAPPLNGKSKDQALATLLKVVGKPGTLENLSEDRVKELQKHYRTLDAKWLELNGRIGRHESSKPVAKTAKVMVSSEGHKPIKHHADGRGYPHFYKETHLLDRGDPNSKGEVVHSSFLPLLLRNGKQSSHWQKAAPTNARTSHRRKAMADWLTDIDNGAGHVVARVIVNRLWQHHFGQGLVTTPNDFGNQGNKPSHPELLDWLASRLIENDWRLKPMHKLILDSATWRQSSIQVEGKEKRDGSLLACYPTRRLEGEVLRDSILAVSGRLDRTLYGKGTLDEASVRRSIYFQIKRSRLIPCMQLFDAPEPLVSQGRRISTTIAPQALLFMNGPHIRKCAEEFTKTLTKKDPLIAAYEKALGRKPRAEEEETSRAFLEQQANAYKAAGQNNPEQLALIDLAQTLFALNEFSYLR
jgi:hypothetical protein